MQVPHNAFVVVADGRKMLFLRNEGDAEYPNLQVEKKLVDHNPKDSDQKTDTAGRSMSAWGGGSQSGHGQPVGYAGGQAGRGQGGQFNPVRSSMQETDFHQLEEDRFAAETAELLKKRALANDFESLIIVAPPKTLGELRKHYHKEVSQRLTGEIDKDLTGHTVPQIEKALLDAE
jgi:protein required for attachment to host cells